MTNQVQYTTEFRISEGKIAEFKSMMQSIIEAVGKNEPDVYAYQVYLNDEENKAFIVERFKDSDAVLLHLANVRPVFPKLLAIAPVVRLDVFGNLTKAADDALRSLGGNIYKYHAGFVRVTP